MDLSLIIPIATLLVVIAGVLAAWFTYTNARKTTGTSFYLEVSHRLDTIWSNLLPRLEDESSISESDIYPIFSHLEAMSTVINTKLVPRKVRKLVSGMAKNHFDELMKDTRAKQYYDDRIKSSAEHFQDLRRLVS